MWVIPDACAEARYLRLADVFVIGGGGSRSFRVSSAVPDTTLLRISRRRSADDRSKGCSKSRPSTSVLAGRLPVALFPISAGTAPTRALPERFRQSYHRHIWTSARAVVPPKASLVTDFDGRPPTGQLG